MVQMTISDRSGEIHLTGWFFAGKKRDPNGRPFVIRNKNNRKMRVCFQVQDAGDKIADFLDVTPVPASAGKEGYLEVDMPPAGEPFNDYVAQWKPKAWGPIVVGAPRGSRIIVSANEIPAACDFTLDSHADEIIFDGGN